MFGRSFEKTSALVLGGSNSCKSGVEEAVKELASVCGKVVAVLIELPMVLKDE